MIEKVKPEIKCEVDGCDGLGEYAVKINGETTVSFLCGKCLKKLYLDLNKMFEGERKSGKKDAEKI